MSQHGTQSQSTYGIFLATLTDELKFEEIDSSFTHFHLCLFYCCVCSTHFCYYIYIQFTVFLHTVKVWYWLFPEEMYLTHLEGCAYWDKFSTSVFCVPNNFYSVTDHVTWVKQPIYFSSAKLWVFTSNSIVNKFNKLYNHVCVI